MDLKLNLTIAITVLLVLSPNFTSADTVILKTGEAIEARKAWEQGDKIFFDLHGMVLSVDKKNVQQIKRAKLDRNDSSLNPNKKKAVLSKRDNEIRRKNVLRNGNIQKPSVPRSSNVYNEVLKPINSNGFRDLRWGQKASSVEGLQKIDTQPDLDGMIQYYRPDDVLKIAKVELKSIVYLFWYEKLYTVTIWTEGRQNYIALREEVFRQFGKGRKSDKHHERYIWSEKKTDRMLEYIESGEFGLLWLRSKVLDRQLKLSELSGPISYLKSIKSKSYKKPYASETGRSK
ncbi:MAG: hypothetical protein PVH43_02520 [Desulfobacterales bacterium]